MHACMQGGTRGKSPHVRAGMQVGRRAATDQEELEWSMPATHARVNRDARHATLRANV